MEREIGQLPPDLPVPIDDGAADHLIGTPLPALALVATVGAPVRLDQGGSPWLVVYAYPRTGRPGHPPVVPGWDLIPGARGCTSEACGFRDHHGELAALGAEVYGLSTQSTEYQREAAERLRLPFPLLSDEGARFAQALRLPTFELGGEVLLKRLTFVARAGTVQHVWYPVFPPDAHAEEVVGWLRTRR